MPPDSEGDPVRRRRRLTVNEFNSYRYSIIYLIRFLK